MSRTRTTYSVGIVLRDGCTGPYALYATETLARAVVATLKSGRGNPGDRDREYKISEYPVEAWFPVAEYGTIIYSNTDVLVIDPDRKYPWPEKLDSEGILRRGGSRRAS